MRRDAGPLLVFGPRSPTYDFGPSHPLTPRRFGPGIDLLRAVGAEPGLAPEPASDEDLLLAHSARYLAVVRRFSADPFGPPGAGIGATGDDPPFAGMHDAAAAVAGGSLRAVEAILRGDVEHAFHPGGGLHHAMPDRASGFCIYDDPALAVARARRAGLRVLYVDLDVHHGDGVQTIHAADPGVLTISFHESGRYLFPGSGFADELGEGIAAGTTINVPLEPFTGEDTWLAAVRAIVPPLAAAFGPELIVSQHGADSHAWDPLAHLRVTTTAMGEAARLVDQLAHGFSGGRWLATGGGGYDVYRVVPRAWALTWLAGAHREAPAETPAGWRRTWSGEAERYGQSPPPSRFLDEPNAGLPVDLQQRSADEGSRVVADAVHGVVVPSLLRLAEEHGWWAPLEPRSGGVVGAQLDPAATPVIVAGISEDAFSRMALAERVVPPLRASVAQLLVQNGLADGAATSVAVAGSTIVGLVLSHAAETRSGEQLIRTVGVAPAMRRRGLGRELVRRHLASLDGRSVEALVTVAERDPVDPLPVETRRAIASRLFEGLGFERVPVERGLASVDRGAQRFRVERR